MHRRAIRGGIACLAVLAAGGAYFWYDSATSVADKGPRAAGRPAVPVTVGVAERREVPIYLTGLGSVQALLSIDIQARVDGELQQVMFTEGQHVKREMCWQRSIRVLSGRHSIRLRPNAPRTRPRSLLPKRI
jgi:multidrug efflux system membrane fusion protein